MRTRSFLRTLGILVLIGGLGPALALARPGGPGDPAQQARFMERMQSLRAVALAEHLKLDTKTALELSGVLKPFDGEALLLERRRHKAHETARAAEEAGKLSHAVVDSLVDEIFQIQGEALKLQRKRLEAVKPLLSPEQRLRFLHVMRRFEERMRRRIRRARRGEMRPGAGPRGEHPRRMRRRHREDQQDLWELQDARDRRERELEEREDRAE